MPDSEVNAITPQPLGLPDQTITVTTSYKQVAEALVKYHNIHDGIWGLYVRFGLGASNVGPDEQQLQPAAIIPLVEIGLQKFAKETNLSVDAAKVNPKSGEKHGVRQRRSRH